MLKLRTPAPDVKLVNAFARPFDNAIAAARTCYSAKGIVTPEEVAGLHLAEAADRQVALEKRDALAQSIFHAGHHTVWQHAHFQFAISRVSRQALWAFFHAHPFYNSEQVSQRYVAVKRDAALIPELGSPAQEIYEETIELQQDAYRRLTQSLLRLAAAAYFAVFPARGRRPDDWRKDIKKRAQEAARYVLPVATWASLYHTISGITLLRYHRVCQQYDVPSEVAQIVQAMVAEVLALDPSYDVILQQPLELEATPEALAFSALRQRIDGTRAAEFTAEFDRELGPWISRLVSASPNAEENVAQAVREVLGLARAALSDDDAIALAADSRRNPIFGEEMNLTTLVPLTRALHHASYTFRRKLSHTADSQDQRHRMTPASRPVLSAHLADAPDFIYPSLVKEDDTVRRDFEDTLARTWEAIGRLRRMGVDEEALVYLLPNAVSIRFTESGDYSALKHKHAMRLCYNAQEEIWRASLDEAQQISAVHPRLGEFLRPPCTTRLRAGKMPVCPEGQRYCGVRVWELEPAQYRRRI